MQSEVDRAAIEEAKQKWGNSDYRQKEQQTESKSNEDDSSLSLGDIVVGIIVIGLGICVFSAIPPEFKKLIKGIAILCASLGGFVAWIKKLFK